MPQSDTKGPTRASGPVFAGRVESECFTLLMSVLGDSDHMQDKIILFVCPFKGEQWYKKRTMTG